MVELHGWALIRENFTVDNEDLNLDYIINRLTQEIEKMDEKEDLLRISICNGEHSLTVTKFTNHFSADIKEVFYLFKLIATIAPGSYGLLYLHDDENNTGFSNEFQVFVLSKGSFKQQKDPFLSPYFPMVEDEDLS
jgi:hypothetical protein